MEPRPETIFDKCETMQQLMMYPALSILPFLRYRVGLRVMKGFSLWLPVLIMAAIGYFTKDYFAFGGYCVLLLLVSYVQRLLRWRDLKAGKVWNTRSLGVSWFEFLPTAPLPARLFNWLYSDNRLYRFADPLLAIVAGVLIGLANRELGGWIIFAGLSLRIFEEYRWERGLDALLDQYDGLITAEEQNRILQELRRPRPQRAMPGEEPQPPAPERPRPPGIADDLQEQVDRRRREAEAREELRRREALAAAEAAARDAERAAEQAREAAERAQDGPAHTHTHIRETVINNTQKETIRETVIVATESREAIGVVIVPAPEPMPAADAAADPAALEQSAAGSAEPAALPDEEREWDVVEGRYRTREAAEAGSASAAQEARELSAPPDKSEGDKAV